MSRFLAHKQAVATKNTAAKPNKSILENSKKVIKQEEKKVEQAIVPEEVEYDGLDPNPSSWGPGTWATLFFLALRCRTPETIKYFQGIAIPILVNLLCSVCSREAFNLISGKYPDEQDDVSRKTTCHPRDYENIIDERGENIGMFVWLVDLHNLVNKRLDKRQYPLSVVKKMYAPLLSLSTEDIKEDSKNALNPETMIDIYKLFYHEEEELPEGGLAKLDAKPPVITGPPVRVIESKPINYIQKAASMIPDSPKPGCKVCGASKKH